MLNEILKNRFTPRAKEVAIEILKELNITKITDDNLDDLEGKLDELVIYLASDHDEGKPIDRELLDIYDLLTDIVIDSEDDLSLLNELFLG